MRAILSGLLRHLRPSGDAVSPTGEFAAFLRDVAAFAGWRLAGMAVLAVLAAAAEGIGLLLLVPLLRRAEADGRQHARRAVPVLLLTICLAESYLPRSNTSLMYVVFTAALWSGTQRART